MVKKFILSLLVLSQTSFISPLKKVQEKVFTESTYSNVIDDLEELAINYNAFKSNSENKFITFSQQFNFDNELKSYVYINVFDDFKITNFYIDMSVENEVDGIVHENFKLYKLDLVSYHDTLKKFEILNISNYDSKIRRYIIQDVMYDEISNGGRYSIFNINNDIRYKSFYFQTKEDESINGFSKSTEYVNVTSKEIVNYAYGDSINFFNYETGLMQSGNTYNDSWFVFFNTNKQIDNLKEVEIVYTQYDFAIGAYGKPNGKVSTAMDCIYSESWVNNFINNIPAVYQGSSFKNDFYLRYNPATTKIVTAGTKKISSTQTHWSGVTLTTYEELDNIMDLRKYNAQNEESFIFSKYANTYTWGVHFNDTIRKFVQKGANGASGIITGSGLTSTAILRLKFETKGVDFNLSAIDTPTSSEDNKGEIAETPIDEDLSIKKIIGKVFSNVKGVLKLFGIVITILLFVLIVLPLLKMIFKPIGRIFKKIRSKK